jgi:hypothetical protein
MAGDLQEGTLDRDSLEKRLSCAVSINLAKESRFEQLYLKYMDLKPN